MSRYGCTLTGGKDNHSIDDILNNDCLLQILVRLDGEDLLNTCRVNRRWQHLTNLAWRQVKFMIGYCTIKRLINLKKFHSPDVSVCYGLGLRELLIRTNKQLRKLHLYVGDLNIKGSTLGKLIGEACPKLTILKTGCFTREFLEVFLHCPNLREIDVDWIVNDDVLIEVLHRCQTLDTLKCFTDSTKLHELFQECPPGLSSLDINNGSEIHSVFINTLSQRCQRLVKLSLYGYMSHVMVTSVCTQLVHLTHLTLMCDNHDILPALPLQLMCNLQYLDISYNNIDDKTLCYVSHCPSLHKLRLECMRVIDINNHMRWIMPTFLRTLDLKYNKTLGLSGISHISKIKTLQCLVLCGCGIGDEAVTTLLEGEHSLRILDVAFNRVSLRILRHLARYMIGRSHSITVYVKETFIPEVVQVPCANIHLNWRHYYYNTVNR